MKCAGLRSTTVQKMKFSINDFFSKCLLTKSLMEDFVFCAVHVTRLFTFLHSIQVLRTNLQSLQLCA